MRDAIGGLGLLLFALLCLTPAAAQSPLADRLWQAAGSAISDYSECAVVPGAEPPATALEASVQYLPALGELLAWRVLVVDSRRCVWLDWPEQRALSARQATGLERLLTAHHAAGEALRAGRLPSAEVTPAPLRATRPGWQPLPAADPGGDRASHPWCPRTPPLAQLIPVDLPERVAPLLVRVRPHRCEPGSRPAAGSGVLLSPDIGMTAAHVILTVDGQVCDRYRVVPGGRRYTDPPAAPFGMAFVSRAYLSGRGGWDATASNAPALNDDYVARTAHDHAYLLLDRAIALPPDTHWPRLRFLRSEPLPPGRRVLRAGYPSIGPVGRIAPGAAVNTYGHVACSRGDDAAYWRFSMWTSPGASGGPIWLWPDRGQMVELLSLAVRSETHGEHQHETLGPRFDETDYWRLLRVLTARRLQVAVGRVNAVAVVPF